MRGEAILSWYELFNYEEIMCMASSLYSPILAIIYSYTRHLYRNYKQ